MSLCVSLSLTLFSVEQPINQPTNQSTGLCICSSPFRVWPMRVGSPLLHFDRAFCMRGRCWYVLVLFTGCNERRSCCPRTACGGCKPQAAWHDSQVQNSAWKLNETAYAKSECEVGNKNANGYGGLSPVRARLSQSASLPHPGQGDGPPAAG